MPLCVGVEETIRYLNDQSIPWGIVTTKRKEFVEKILRASKLTGKGCKVLVCSEDVAETKPSPEGLIKACKALACSPEVVLYVGDDLVDTAAAHAGGLQCAIVLQGNLKTKEEAVGADYCFGDMFGLLQEFKKSSVVNHFFASTRRAS